MLSVMKMKANVKYYLFYAGIFLIGASISAGLFFAYGAELFPCEGMNVSGKFSFSELNGLASSLIMPLTALFLSAFTLYACAVGGITTLYIGAIFGRLTIRYCLSEHVAFTHGAALIITQFVGAIFIILSKEATVLRGAMKTVSPEPEKLIKNPACVNAFKTYLSTALTAIAASVGAYLLLIYFKI